MQTVHVWEEKIYISQNSILQNHKQQLKWSICKHHQSISHRDTRKMRNKKGIKYRAGQDFIKGASRTPDPWCCAHHLRSASVRVSIWVNDPTTQISCTQGCTTPSVLIIFLWTMQTNVFVVHHLAHLHVYLLVYHEHH